MLDNLSKSFKDGLGYMHVSGILQQLANIANMINIQYMKDGDAKNGAIDTICAMLQSHKEAPVVATKEIENAVA